MPGALESFERCLFRKNGLVAFGTLSLRGDLTLFAHCVVSVLKVFPLAHVLLTVATRKAFAVKVTIQCMHPFVIFGDCLTTSSARALDLGLGILLLRSFVSVQHTVHFRRQVVFVIVHLFDLDLAPLGSKGLGLLDGCLVH